MTFNGRSWSRPIVASSFAESDVEVSCSSSSFCIAVSGNGGFIRWNGRSWSRVAGLPLSNPGFSAISCSSPSFCLLTSGSEAATGNSSTTYTTWNGRSWTHPLSVALLNVSSISCTKASFCMGVGQETVTGNAGTLFANDIATSWDGSLWSSPVDLGDGLGTGNVSCSSNDSCLAVGGFHATGDVFAWWNGRQWSKESNDANGTGLSPEGFESVSCLGSSFCVATDGGAAVNGDPATSSPPVASMWDGETWTPFPKKDGIEGGIVSCAKAQRCMIVASTRFFVSTM